MTAQLRERIAEAVQVSARVDHADRHRKNANEWLRRARVSLFEGDITVARARFDRAVDEMELSYR